MAPPLRKLRVPSSVENKVAFWSDMNDGWRAQMQNRVQRNRFRNHLPFPPDGVHLKFVPFVK